MQLSEATVSGTSGAYRGHGLVVKPFLRMWGKGILPCPQKPEDKLSVSSVALGMRKSSETFLDASRNSHEIAIYSNDPQWVFSRLQCFWGQAPTPAADFGYYGVGRRRQALNFIPKNPYGLVQIIQGDGSTDPVSGVKQVISTDGEYWYDAAGVKKTAADYASQVENVLQIASEKMPVLVQGDVAWTATRIDNTHLRLVLIDSGYLDPDDRTAIVTIRPTVFSAYDILSREPIVVNNQQFTLTIPMGALRVIDITVDSLSSQIHQEQNNLFSVNPNPFTDVIHIQSKNGSKEWETEIFDLSGKCLIHDKNSHQLNTQNLDQGAYIIKIKSGVVSYTRKIFNLKI